MLNGTVLELNLLRQKAIRKCSVRIKVAKVSWTNRAARHQATPCVRLGFKLNQNMASQELVWQKVSRSCQEAASWPDGDLPNCCGVFCPGGISGSTLSSHFCAGTECQFPLDLQRKAQQEGPQHANQELHLLIPLRNKGVYFFGTIQFSFIGFTYNKLLLWTVKFGISSWGLLCPTRTDDQ